MGVSIKRRSAESVLGVDPSTKTGIVVLGKDGEVFFKEEYGSGKVEAGNSKSRIDRALSHGKKIRSIIDIWHPVLMVVEGYGYANTNTLALLVEIGAAIRFCAVHREVPFVEVPPNSLKKFVTGNGVAKKDHMLLATYKRWKFETESDNVCDAYGLARVGWCILGVPPANAGEREAVAKLKSGK